jgi:hypothetical protein
MISIQELAEKSLHTWFEREYHWKVEHALAAANYEEWQQIIDAFMAGYMACFWNEE